MPAPHASPYADRLPLRFGLFNGPHHSTRLDPTYAYERDLLLAQHLDRLGYDELWFGEHHSGGFEMIPAPEVMIAAAAERTRHIRLGTGVKTLPYHNPFILAETMAQLDHMTRGRVMFGCGPGAMVTDAQMQGIPVSEMRPRMEQALDALVPLLRGETVTMRSDWFNLVEARLSVGCYTRPMIETAVTSVRSPAGVAAAGKHGLGVLTLGGFHDEALRHHLDNWAIHGEVCARHGHAPDRSKWRLTMFIHLAETREQAKADCAFGIREWIKYTHDVVSTGGQFPLDHPDPVQWAIDNQRAIVGTPDDAIREIERIQETLGGFGAVLVFGQDWASWGAMLRSFELLAEYVRPHFTGSNRMRRESYGKAAVNQGDNVKKVLSAIAEATDRYKTQARKGEAAD